MGDQVLKPYHHIFTATLGASGIQTKGQAEIIIMPPGHHDRPRVAPDLVLLRLVLIDGTATWNLGAEYDNAWHIETHHICGGYRVDDHTGAYERGWLYSHRRQLFTSEEASETLQYYWSLGGWTDENWSSPSTPITEAVYNERRAELIGSV